MFQFIQNFCLHFYSQFSIFCLNKFVLFFFYWIENKKNIHLFNKWFLNWNNYLIYFLSVPFSNIFSANFCGKSRGGRLLLTIIQRMYSILDIPYPLLGHTCIKWNRSLIHINWNHCTPEIYTLHSIGVKHWDIHNFIIFEFRFHFSYKK